MAAIVKITAGNQVAVGEQNRAGMLVTDHGGGEFAHHIRTIGKTGDGAEPLGLALGAIISRRKIQTLKGGVAGGVDSGCNRHLKRFLRHFRDGQQAVGKSILPCRQRDSVQRNLQQLQAFTIEHQRLPMLLIGTAIQMRLDQRGLRVKFNAQVDSVHQEGGRVIVFKKDFLFLCGQRST